VLVNTQTGWVRTDLSWLAGALVVVHVIEIVVSFHKVHTGNSCLTSQWHSRTPIAAVWPAGIVGGVKAFVSHDGAILRP
jgi:hypothetical protein